MELGKPDPATPAALVGAVSATALVWLTGLQTPLIPTLPVFAGVFWLACRQQRWLWRPPGRVGRVAVPLTPALGFAGLVGLNRLTGLAVPPAPGGLLTVVTLFLAGAWLAHRIRVQHLLERTETQAHLLTWEGAQPARTQFLTFAGSVFGTVLGIVFVQSVEEGPSVLLSVETYAPTIVGSFLGIGIAAVVGSRASFDYAITYTAFEKGLLIEKLRFVPAEEIRGYERRDSELVIETETRLDSLLGTRLFGTRKVGLSDIDDVEAVCRVLDQYQSVGGATPRDGPDHTPAA